MLVIHSQNRIPIRLTEERWQHIVRRHPEMETLREQVLETISEPDTIQDGDSGECLALRLYPETPLTSKHLVAVYREVSEQDGFLLTAYLTSRPSSRRSILWKR